MEKKYTTLSASNNLSERVKSIIREKDGRKSIEDIIKEGEKSRQEKIDKGWHETPDGLMPITEVKKAGYVLNEDNEWTIPSEEYMADGNYGRPPGEKYIGPSRQYLDWKKARKNKDSNKVEIPTTNKLNFEKDYTPILETDYEIDVSKIPF